MQTDHSDVWKEIMINFSKYSLRQPNYTYNVSYGGD